MSLERTFSLVLPQPVPPSLRTAAKIHLFRLLFGLIAITRNKLCKKRRGPFPIRDAGTVKFSKDRLIVLLGELDACHRRFLVRSVALRLSAQMRTRPVTK